MVAENTPQGRNYSVSPCFHNCVVGIAPKHSAKLFQRFSNQDLGKRARVLVYLDEESLDREGDSTRYLASTLAMNPYFQVALSTNYDPDLASQADVVLVRFDPPTDEDFLMDLERYNEGSRLFINPPSAQKKFSNKRYLEDLAKEHPDILPMTSIVSSSEELVDFIKKLEREGKTELVYKPLEGLGGYGIGKIALNHSEGRSKRLYSLRQLIAREGEVVLQEGIKNVEGDKRIHVINREPIGAVLRVPKAGEFRCNIKQGGSVKKTVLTERDYEIVDRLALLLEEDRVYWAGIDVLQTADGQSFLGEINAVSPGCLVGADLANGTYNKPNSIASEFAEDLELEMKIRSIV